MQTENAKTKLDESDFPDYTDDDYEDDDLSLGTNSANTSPNVSQNGSSKKKAKFKLKPITFDDDLTLLEEEQEKIESKMENDDVTTKRNTQKQFVSL